MPSLLFHNKWVVLAFNFLVTWFLGFVFLVTNYATPYVWAGWIVFCVSSALVSISYAPKQLLWFINPWVYVFWLDLVLKPFDLFKEYYVNEPAPWYEPVFVVGMGYIVIALWDVGKTGAGFLLKKRR